MDPSLTSFCADERLAGIDVLDQVREQVMRHGAGAGAWLGFDRTHVAIFGQAGISDEVDELVRRRPPARRASPASRRRDPA